MDTGAFVCSCAGTCDIDLKDAREGIENVEVAASSSLLCQDKIGAFEQVLEEYDLDELIVTCPQSEMQEKLTAVAETKGIRREEIEFVDQRERAGWVHEESVATEKTARLVNAAKAGRREMNMPRSSIHQAGYDVVVVGDAETASTLAGAADVTLIADGEELADADLDDIEIERGRVVDTDGTYGDFEVTVRAQVTEDCISCMKCVEAGPDGMVTRRPVDIDPDAPRGEWIGVCPTDAIDMDGVERTFECDQIVYPNGDNGTIGGQRGFYTGPVDGLTINSVQRLLGGFEGPDFLDFEMDVCAAGHNREEGCNVCVDACPHGAVERTNVDEVGFHLDSCQDCGACTSACPTGAVQLDDPNNRRIAREVETLLDPGSDDGGVVSGLLGGSEKRLVSEQFPRDASPQSLDNGFRLLDRWGSAVDDPAATADELRKVHTRLFVGPRPRMQIHESWYADDFLGEPLSAVRSTYQDLGVEESNELREEPDHAAVELAALEMLARDGADGYRQAFLSVHGWWLPELAEDLRELSDDTFYEAIGWLLEGILEADSYRLSLDLNELSPGYDDGPTVDGNR